jgi:hypothetical protein
MSYPNSSINGGPPKDAAFSNLAVSNTLVVRGTQHVQDLQAGDATILGQISTDNLIVVGNQEIDGDLSVKGTAVFHNTPITPITTMGIPFAEAEVTGMFEIHRQGSVVVLSIEALNGTGSAITAATVLGTIDAADRPLVDVYITAVNVTASTFVLLKLESTTGEVTVFSVSSPAAAWATAQTISGTATWIAHQ